MEMCSRILQSMDDYWIENRISLYKNQNSRMSVHLPWNYKGSHDQREFWLSASNIFGMLPVENVIINTHLISLVEKNIVEKLLNFLCHLTILSSP